MIQAPAPSTDAVRGPLLLMEVDAERLPRFAPSPEVGWRLLGGFGALLLLVGLGDIALAWFPLRPGNAEWEFGAIHQTMTTLPLPTIGAAAMLASAFALGKRGLVRAVAGGLLILMLALLALDVIFLTLIPLVLGAVPDAVRPGIQKLVARTLLAGVAFPVAYLLAGVAAWRLSRLKRVRP